MDEEFKFSTSVDYDTGASNAEQSLYALRAVAKANTSVGIVASDGIVIATATRVSSALMDPQGVQHVAAINRMIGMTYSGLSGDFRVLKQAAQKSAITDRLINGVEVDVGLMAHSMASLMQQYTQNPDTRSFGVSLLIAGYDKWVVPHLCVCSATGSHTPKKAIALGRNAGICTNFLEQRYSESLRVEDAINAALLALKMGYETKQPGEEQKQGEPECPMPTNAIQMGIAYREGFECMRSDFVDEFYADLC